MNVSSLCHREIVSIGASASVRDAAEAMRQHMRRAGVRRLASNREHGAAAPSSSG